MGPATYVGDMDTADPLAFPRRRPTTASTHDLAEVDAAIELVAARSRRAGSAWSACGAPTVAARRPRPCPGAQASTSGSTATGAALALDRRVDAPAT